MPPTLLMSCFYDNACIEHNVAHSPFVYPLDLCSCFTFDCGSLWALSLPTYSSPSLFSVLGYIRGFCMSGNLQSNMHPFFSFHRTRVDFLTTWTPSHTHETLTPNASECTSSFPDMGQAYIRFYLIILPHAFLFSQNN